MAETKTVNLDIKTNIGSLKSQLRQAQAEVAALSDKFGATSTEAANAAKKAAELKDRIEDAKNLTDAFNPDAKFNALSSSIGGVLNGFQAYEGAMGLIGVESEELQKTLLKVQSAMALSQGIQGALEAKDSFIQLGAVAKSSFKTLASSAKAAFTSIKGGVAATGIGLLLIAVGTLVSYWDEISAAMSGVSDEQEKLNRAAAKDVTVQRAKLDALNGQDSILKLQGKSEREIAEIKMKQIDQLLLSSKIQLEEQRNTKKAQVEATKRNFDILKIVARAGAEMSALSLRLLVAPIDAVLETANLVAETLGLGKISATNINKEITKLTEAASEGLSKFLFNPDEIASEANATIKETKDAIKTLEQQRADLQLSIQEIDKQAALEAKQMADDKLKEEEERKRKELELLNQVNQNKINAQNELDDALEEISERNYQNSLSEQEREIRLIEDKYFELETLAKGNADALAQIEIAKLNEINDVNLKYQELESKAREDKKAKDKEQREKDLELEKKLQADKYQLAYDSLNLISEITTLFGQKNERVAKAMFNIDKAAKLASATMSAREGVINAYKTAQDSPLTAILPAYPYIQAGLAGAFGAVNIAKIASQKFQASGGSSDLASSGTGGGGGQASMSPSFNVVGNSGMNQLAQIQQTPIQAFVVSGEVTSAQALDRNRIKNATL